jgi:hypothetical protein
VQRDVFRTVCLYEQPTNLGGYAGETGKDDDLPPWWTNAGAYVLEKQLIADGAALTGKDGASLAKQCLFSATIGDIKIGCTSVEEIV